MSNEYIKKYNKKARSIPTLPDVIGYKDISSVFGKNDSLILGISKESLNISEYRYKKNLVNLVISQDIEDEYFLIKPMINELLCLKNDITVIDADEYEMEELYKKYTKYYEVNYEDAFKNLVDFADKVHKKYTENNYNLASIKDEKEKTVVIIGFSNMMQRLSMDGRKYFEKLLELSKDTKKVNIILFDNVNGIKKFEIDSWFKNYVNPYDGIYIGNGINDQYTIKILKRTLELKEDIKASYGFVIRRGTPVMVKFIESFDIKFN